MAKKLAGMAAAFLIVASVLPAVAVPDNNTQDGAAICEEAARIASQESGVPLDVLRAIFLTETGRKRNGRFEPWPWTVNMEGIGKWFDDPSAALSYVKKNMARGATSFDVGCFQINYRWHGKAFSSVEEMFSPLPNARYAARFLSDLYAEFGNWTRAAGAYHSRTPKFARKYEARFDRFRKSSGAQAPVMAEVRPTSEPVIPAPKIYVRENTFPLLRSGSGSRLLASLVPLQQEAGNGRFISLSGGAQ